MASPLTDLYEVRDGNMEDKNFVLATFLRGLYYGDSWFSRIDKDIFMDNYKKIAEALFTRGMVKIACLKQDPSVILGYSLLSTDYQAIHFVYVKKSWRGVGIAKSLTPRHPQCVTHLTDVGISLLKKYPDVIFNPFRLGV